MEKHIRLTALGIGHFFIDFLGIYLINIMYNHLSFLNIAFYFLLYNLIAFGLQPFVGFIADTKKKYFEFALIGLLLAIIALAFPKIGVFAIILATIGNAMYHVGGGVLAMNLYPNKSAPAGIFVAPGAVGVFLGIYLANISMDYQYFIMGLAIFSLIGIFALFDQYKLKHTYQSIHPQVLRLIGLILAVVLVRGFVGSLLIFTWRGDLTYTILLVISVFLGKFIGGMLGDKFGYKEIGVYGLVLSLPFLIFGVHNPILGLMGALLFNLTMAITLFLIIDSLGLFKGVAFGLTTLTLVVAFMPFHFGFSIPLGFWYYSIIIVLIIGAAYALYNAVNIYADRKGE